jgi:hypothetical protein
VQNFVSVGRGVLLGEGPKISWESEVVLNTESSAAALARRVCHFSGKLGKVWGKYDQEK